MKIVKSALVLAILALSVSFPTKGEALPVPTGGPGVTGCYITIAWTIFAGGMAVPYPKIICPVTQ